MKLRIYQSGGVFKRFDFNNLYANSQEDIKELQRELGVVDDGIIGGKTIRALQKRVGTNADGAWGKNSKEAASSYIQSLQSKPEEEAPKEKSRWKLFSLKEKQEQPEVEKEKQKVTAWTPNSVEGSVQNNKAYRYDTKTKSWVPTEECAEWANDSLRRYTDSRGRTLYTTDNIGGSAWNRLTAGKDAKMVYSGYDTEDYNRKGYSASNSNKRNHAASNKLKSEFKDDMLDKSKVYLVNMYYDNSPYKRTAWKEGSSGVTGTHTGNLYWNEDTQSWRVAHNIHGKIHDEDFSSIQGDNTGKGYGVTAIAEAPRVKYTWADNAKYDINQVSKKIIGRNILKNGGSLTLKWQKGAINKPIYLSEIYITPNKNKTQFMNDFNDFRDEAKKEYGISDDEYDDLLTNATAIAKLESNFGDSRRYKVKSAMPDAILKAAKFILQGQKSSKSGLSKGLTQIKYKSDIENNSELSDDYSKYGITEKSLEDPSVSAKATAIRLIHGKKHLQDSTYNYSDGTEVPENTKLAMWWHAGDNAFPSNGIVDSLRNYTKRFNSLINQQ